QAEDGIRDSSVTGVQTCALPISLRELVRLRESGTITHPSKLVRDLDPLIERVILRCLESDPDKRPASALQVAAALPGGDPLAAEIGRASCRERGSVTGARVRDKR